MYAATACTGVNSAVLDLVIVGAGPCGLACAAAAEAAGLRYLVFDRGCICSGLTRLPTYVRFFSTADRLEIGGVPFHLRPHVRPERRDLLTYYHGVVAELGLDVRQHEEVVAAERLPDGFVVHTKREGRPRSTYHARAVAVAAGVYGHPRHLGVSGEHLPHVTHYYTEPYAFSDRDVVVVGGRNSAVEAALDLHRHGARVTLVHRGAPDYRGVKPWLRPELEAHARAGTIRTLWATTVTAVAPGAVEVAGPGGRERLAADQVFALIGYTPDLTLVRGLGASIDGATGRPYHDEHFETDVPGLFVLAGQAEPDNLIERGRHHGPAVVRRLTAALRSGATA